MKGILLAKKDPMHGGRYAAPNVEATVTDNVSHDEHADRRIYGARTYGCVGR